MKKEGKRKAKKLNTNININKITKNYIGYFKPQTKFLFSYYYTNKTYPIRLLIISRLIQVSTLPE